MTIGVGISNLAFSATSVGSLQTATGKTSQVSGSSFYIALFYITSGAPTTVTDTFSNVYTAVTAEVQNTSDGGYMRVYQCQNGTGGANHQAGVVWSPTQLGVLMFAEVTGGATSSILDQQNCVYDTGGSPFPCVLPTTTNAADLLLGFTIVQSANTSEAFSSPTLTNTVFSFNFSTTALFAGATMSARVTSTGAYDAAISDTAGYSKALVAMLALKEAGGTGAVLAATPAADASVSGALSTGIKAAALVSAKTSSSGSLTTGSNGLSAVAQARTASSGALVNGITLAGNANARAGFLAALTNFATVVLSGTLYTGIGGALDPNFWPDGVLPTDGTTLYYDPTFITIEPSGEIVSTSNNCIAAVGFYVGSTWYPGIIALTPQMVGYAYAAASALAALTTGFALSAAASAGASASGVLSAVGAILSASAFARTGFAAGISTGINLAAIGSAKTQSQGLLTTGISMVAQVTGLTYASAAMGVGAVLTVTAAGLASASGALFTGIPLLASASARTGASAVFAGSPAVLSAVAFARPSAIGGLSTGISLSASASASAQASAALAGSSAALAAVVSARTAANGALSASIALVAAPTARPYALASLSIGAGLSVTASGRTSAAASATTQIQLSGQALATSLANGSLTTIPFSLPPVTAERLSLDDYGKRIILGTGSMGTFNRSMLAGEKLGFQVDVSQRVVSEWQPSGMYLGDDLVRPTDANETGFLYQTGAEGQSGPIEPSWATPAGSVTQDGSLTWTALVPPASSEDTIASVLWVQINPPDGALVINGQATGTLTASAYLGVGTSGLVYTVNAEVTMTSGAVYIAQIVLTVT